MNQKYQAISAIAMIISFIIGIIFSAIILLRNNEILENTIKKDEKCVEDSLKIIKLEYKVDSLIKLTKKKK